MYDRPKQALPASEYERCGFSNPDTGRPCGRLEATHVIQGIKHQFVPSAEPAAVQESKQPDFTECRDIYDVVDKALSTESVAKGAAEKAALLPCPFCEIKDQQRVDDGGGTWVRIEHGDECLIRWNFASGIQFIHQSNWARWNHRDSIDPASLSAERCAEVLTEIEYEGYGWMSDSLGVRSEGNVWLRLSDARIICAYHLEHGLGREGEGK